MAPRHSPSSTLEILTSPKNDPFDNPQPTFTTHALARDLPLSAPSQPLFGGLH